MEAVTCGGSTASLPHFVSSFGSTLVQPVLLFDRDITTHMFLLVNIKPKYKDCRGSVYNWDCPTAASTGTRWLLPAVSGP